MKKNIYRQQALERLSSPERLNQMVQIAPPKAWLALIGLVGVFIALGFWSFLGELPKNVNGRGILIQAGGITEVASLSAGKIEQILYKEGDMIAEGDVIAIISQPELEMQLQNAASKLEELNEQYLKLASFDEEDYKRKRELLEKKQDIQLQTIKANNERLLFINEQIGNQKQLLDEGLITKETLNNTKQLYFEIQQQIDILRNELKSINLDLFEFSKKNEIDLTKLKSEIFELERHIKEISAKFLLTSSIKSPYDGRVVELLVNAGRVVKYGDNVISMEVATVSRALEAVIYMPPSDGKKVEEGMRVKISPSTVEVEEYGYILGTVVHVSDYPASIEGMERFLGNTDLAKALSGDEPPIAIFVDLEQDTASVSQYKWTSVGPPTQIKSGTFCNGYITIEKQRPITLLFPRLKETLN